MTIGYCRDCCHWGDRSFAVPGVTDFAPKETGFCRLSVSIGAKPQHPESLAVAADHEGYKSVLITRPDYGCIQFQARGVDS
jgi:hypothetical protein